MMIVEFTEFEHVGATALECVAKTGRIADAAKGRHPQPMQSIKWLLDAVGRHESAWGVSDFQPQGPGRVSLDFVANGPSSLGIEQVGTREGDDVRSRQTADGLAERAAGKDVTEAKRLQGVDQHDVEIAGNAAVLEGVVQNDQLALELVD